MEKDYDTLVYDTLERLYLEQVTNGFEWSNVSYVDVSYVVRRELGRFRRIDSARRDLCQKDHQAQTKSENKSEFSMKQKRKQ
jgi:hypothetical protein